MSAPKKAVNVMEYTKLDQNNPDTFSLNLQMLLVARTLFQGEEQVESEMIIESYRMMGTDLKSYRIN